MGAAILNIIGRLISGAHTLMIRHHSLIWKHSYWTRATLFGSTRFVLAPFFKFFFICGESGYKCFNNSISFTPMLVIWHHSLNTSTSRPIIYVFNFSINFKILHIYACLTNGWWVWQKLGSWRTYCLTKKFQFRILWYGIVKYRYGIWHDMMSWIIIAKVLDYNMVYSQGLPNDKKVA